MSWLSRLFQRCWKNLKKGPHWTVLFWKKTFFTCKLAVTWRNCLNWMWATSSIAETGLNILNLVMSARGIFFDAKWLKISFQLDLCNLADRNKVVGRKRNESRGTKEKWLLGFLFLEHSLKFCAVISRKMEIWINDTQTSGTLSDALRVAAIVGVVCETLFSFMFKVITHDANHRSARLFIEFADRLSRRTRKKTETFMGTQGTTDAPSMFLGFLLWLRSCEITFRF